MAVVLAVSICVNVFQALIFWFFMYAWYYKEKRESKK